MRAEYIIALALAAWLVGFLMGDSPDNREEKER